MKLKPRTIFRIQWHTELRVWILTVDRNVICAGGVTKAQAIAAVRHHAAAMLENHGIRSQLVVHGKNGRIQAEYTYGDDPKRRKG